MKLTVDPEADALYLRLNEAEIVDSEQVAAGVVLDYDANDNVVGVEILHLSQRGGTVDVEKLVFEILRSRQPDEAIVREHRPQVWREVQGDDPGSRRRVLGLGVAVLYGRLGFPRPLPEMRGRFRSIGSRSVPDPALGKGPAQESQPGRDGVAGTAGEWTRRVRRELVGRTPTGTRRTVPAGPTGMNLGPSLQVPLEPGQRLLPHLGQVHVPHARVNPAAKVRPRPA